MLALGILRPEEFFSMIYGDPDDEANPSTGGRNFNNHFSTSNLNSQGEISDLQQQYNSASDISPTAGQMPRALGLAQASQILRKRPDLAQFLKNKGAGNEVVFATIGDASTSEGIFFETLNAAGVMQVPLAVVIYDDGYGISVPTSLQTVKGSISDVLEGFSKEVGTNGIIIYKAKGWDYPGLLHVFGKGIKYCRENHVPVVFHIEELTQPGGHSTSGSHERYKDASRLNWEMEYDANIKFKEWLLNDVKIESSIIEQIEKEAWIEARAARDKAWAQFKARFSPQNRILNEVIVSLKNESGGAIDHTQEIGQIEEKSFPTFRAIFSLAKRIYFEIHSYKSFDKLRLRLLEFIHEIENKTDGFYHEQDAVNTSYTEGSFKVDPIYNEQFEEVNGSVILNQNFDALFRKYPHLLTFGEDTGYLGDVNQGMKGMQEKYGPERVSDTGIREATIIGQGIGLALRGFRPIAEIQYLDYLVYALSQLSDDLATLSYRTKGKQAAPLIVRTRGHQLQGIWHAGSPMMMLLGSLRGMHVCVPRNMTQAAGFYNTLLATMEPALVIEPLKGYNCKERVPINPGWYTVPLGVPEIIVPGDDVTLVTYGWNVHHAEKAAHLLQNYKISVEVIDVQTLLPFDINQLILQSVKKTGKVLFVDEDVPGGASAYMMQKVIEEQGAFHFLDTAPRTLSAATHRPAYGIDGEYFTKPNVEQIFEVVWQMMHETDGVAFPALFEFNYCKPVG